jgi:hypothetical protein
MINLADRTVWMLKFAMVMSYGAAAIILSGAVLVLAYWRLTSFVVMHCSTMGLISAGFMWAGRRNQLMLRKRLAERDAS